MLSPLGRDGKVYSAICLAHSHASGLQSATFFDRYNGPNQRYGFSASFTSTSTITLDTPLFANPSFPNYPPKSVKAEMHPPCTGTQHLV